MIDIKKLREDLARIGYMLAGKNLREELPTGEKLPDEIRALELTPTSPSEAEWALRLAINAQTVGSHCAEALEAVVAERKIGTSIQSQLAERDIGPCGRCDGEGQIYDLTRLPSPCPTCKGTGRLTTTIPEHNPWID